MPHNSDPANTTHRPNVGPMLARRLRRRPNIGPTLGRRAMVAGTYESEFQSVKASTQGVETHGACLLRCQMGVHNPDYKRLPDYYHVLNDQ